MQLCGALCGRMSSSSWYSGREVVDYFSAKGIVEELMADLQIFNCEFVSNSNSLYHPGKSSMITHDGVTVGFVGELHPQIISNYGISVPVCIFELDL